MKRVRALLQEVRELGDELKEVAQREEAAVERPGRANERLQRVDVHVDVVLAPAQDGALAHGLLAGVGLGVEVLDCGLGDPVEEAEAGRGTEVSGEIGCKEGEAYCSWPFWSPGRTTPFRVRIS